MNYFCPHGRLAAWCGKCADPGDEPEYMEAVNRQVDRDFHADSPEEQARNRWSEPKNDN